MRFIEVRFADDGVALVKDGAGPVEPTPTISSSDIRGNGVVLNIPMHINRKGITEVVLCTKRELDELVQRAVNGIRQNGGHGPDEPAPKPSSTHAEAEEAVVKAQEGWEPFRTPPPFPALTDKPLGAMPDPFEIPPPSTDQRSTRFPGPGPTGEELDAAAASRPPANTIGGWSGPDPLEMAERAEEEEAEREAEQYRLTHSKRVGGG